MPERSGEPTLPRADPPVNLFLSGEFRTLHCRRHGMDILKFYLKTPAALAFQSSRDIQGRNREPSFSSLSFIPRYVAS